MTSRPVREGSPRRGRAGSWRTTICPVSRSRSTRPVSGQLGPVPSSSCCTRCAGRHSCIRDRNSDCRTRTSRPSGRSTSTGATPAGPDPLATAVASRARGGIHPKGSRGAAGRRCRGALRPVPGDRPALDAAPRAPHRSAAKPDPALQNCTQRTLDAGPDVLAWLREVADARYLVMVNFAAQSRSPAVPPELPTAGTIMVGTDPDRVDTDQDSATPIGVRGLTLAPGEALLIGL